MKGFTIYCPECGGNGFTGYGTGYDCVCDYCGGEQLEFISLDKANKVMDRYRFIILNVNDTNDIMNEYINIATDEDGNEYNFIDSEMQYEDFGIIINLDIYIVHIESGTIWKNNDLDQPEYEVIEYCKKIIDEVRMCNLIYDTSQ